MCSPGIAEVPNAVLLKRINKDVGCEYVMIHVRGRVSLWVWMRAIKPLPWFPFSSHLSFTLNISSSQSDRTHTHTPSHSSSAS
jgi:hypothetical protein